MKDLIESRIPLSLQSSKLKILHNGNSLTHIIEEGLKLSDGEVLPVGLDLAISKVRA